MQAQVIEADLPAINAVVHIIDAVLLPVNLSSLVAPEAPEVAAPAPVNVQPASAAAGLAASGALAALAALAAALLA